MLKDRSDEEPRLEGKRKKKIKFSYENVNKHFYENLSDIEEKFALADREKSTGDLKSAQEIWRSQVVFLDSALDFYIHEVAKLGIIRIFNGDWAETEKYRKIKVSMDFALKMADSHENADALLDEIDEINQYNCFMKFGKIQETLHLIGLDADTSNQEGINDLCSRRNQIAHQSDRLPNDTNKQPISKKDVQKYIASVKSLVADINSKVKEKEKDLSEN